MIEDTLMEEWVDRIDTELVRYFARKDMSCNPLDRAMEYTLLAGGKRLRPLLTMVVCHEFGGDAEQVLPMSLAAELLHTYSLIHDDLPSMDNDEMRRGKPTNHVIFGEANAILAGDALQAEAFAILTDSPFDGLDAARRVRITSEFAHAVGRKGMVAGQVMDLESSGKTIDRERLTLLHQRKTGALLTFSIRLGGHLAGLDEAGMEKLDRYAGSIGLLFQVVDDLLDQESSSEVLGKTAGKDSDQDKATFPKLLGSENAHAYADELLEQALAALDELPAESDRLVQLARYIRKREH